MITASEIDSEDEFYDFHKKVYRYVKKFVLPIFVVGLLGTTFCPTKTDALLIYGVGGSIDYLRNNPVAKKLPDKCIDALDKWIDELYPKKNKDSEENK